MDDETYEEILDDGDIEQDGVIFADVAQAGDDGDIYAYTADAQDDAEEMPDVAFSEGTSDNEPINENTAEIDTTVAVSEGDRVLIALDAQGVPTVIGVVGEGDDTANEIEHAQQWSLAALDAAEAAETAATEAAAVAAAVNQHFWSDSSGAHVTDVTQEDWQTAEQSGFPDASATKQYSNILLNSLGILLRSALTNLVSITKSAISFFDGAGNAASNVVATFGANGITIGKSNAMQVAIDADSVDFIFHGVTSGGTAYVSTASLQYDQTIDRISLSGGQVYLQADRSTGLTAQNTTASGFATSTVGVSASGDNADMCGARALVSHSSGTRTYDSLVEVTPFAVTLTTGSVKINGEHVARSVNGNEANSNGAVTIPNASASAAGLMTSALFSKLNNQDDYIVETGTNSSSSTSTQWRWIKFNSGYCICWGYASLSVTATTSWGSCYYGTISARSYPFTFDGAPYEFVNFTKSGYYWPVATADGNTSTKTASYYAVAPNKQSTARSIWIEYLVVGRWK